MLTVSTCGYIRSFYLLSSLSRIVISATAEEIRLYFSLDQSYSPSRVHRPKKGFSFRSSGSFRSRSYQMAVKCFLMFFLFIYILPACWVVGGILVKKKRRFNPSSLFVPETAVEIHSESCRPI